MTRPRFHLVMENVAGKLDERFADTAPQAKQKLLAMIADCDLRDGDCFRVIDRREDD
jgi:hypothetical protein